MILIGFLVCLAMAAIGVESTVYTYNYVGSGVYCATSNWCVNRVPGGSTYSYGIFDSINVPIEATMITSYGGTISLVTPAGTVDSGPDYMDVSYGRLPYNPSGYDVIFKTSLTGDELKFNRLIYQVLNPVVTGVTGVSFTGGGRVTIVGDYFAGEQGNYYPPSTYVTVGGVQATIVSVNKNAIVIDTPALTAGVKTVSVVYPSVTVGGSVTYSGNPTFASPPLVSGSSFPLTGGALTVHGANFGLHANIWSLVKDSVVIVASSVGRTDVSQASSWVVFQIPASSTFTNQGDWTLTYSRGSITTIKIPINYLPGLTDATEYTETFLWNTNVNGPWPSSLNPNVKYLISRRGYVVTISANFEFFNVATFASTAEVKTVSAIPERFRSTNGAIRCYNHVTYNGGGHEGHTDYEIPGTLKYHWSPNGAPYTSSPYIYAGTCTWIRNK